MKIAILDDYQHCVQALDCYAMLNDHDVKVFTNSARGVGQLAIRLHGFDALVLIGARSPVPKALLEKLPHLKLISQVGHVGEHLDINAATACGIAVAEAATDPVAPAELTWALIMAVTRKIPQYASNLINGRWQTVSLSTAHNTLGTVLKGRTLGIWGYGKIGRLVAAYARAFGMQVVVWGSDTSRADAVADGLMAAVSREGFFADCDIISMHLRVTDATRAIVTAEDFARMKPLALFVNTSSAKLVASDALVGALQQGRPGYAALDVFDSEPLPPDSPLMKMPNVLATPHIGFVEKDSYEMAFHTAFQNVIDFFAGNPQNIVNPAALQARA